MKRLTHLLALMLFCALLHGQETDSLALAGLPAAVDTTGGPVSHLGITSAGNNKISLRWQAAPGAGEEESFFTVERSANGTDFSAIGVIRNDEKGWFVFVDDGPGQGRVYYRVKRNEGQSVYCSSTVFTYVSNVGSPRFYPNPVDKALIVRTESAVELQIADRFGKTVMTDRLQPGLKVLDVSSLEPGVYIISLYQREINKLSSEKLVKK